MNFKSGSATVVILNKKTGQKVMEQETMNEKTYI